MNLHDNKTFFPVGSFIPKWVSWISKIENYIINWKDCIFVVRLKNENSNFGK